MAVQVQQYEHNPILMVAFTGQFDITSVNKMNAKSASYLETIGSSALWRLVDFTQAHITFADVMNMVKHVNPHDAGGFADPRIHTIFCPSHPMAKLTVEMLAKQEYGNVKLQIFPGLGEALLYIQDEITTYGAGV